ncbi:cytoplasmic protein [BEV proteobacterium]|nr:cytoplasmic protein [Candidatus Symbiopectobacterium sp. Chty_BC]
MEKEDLIAIATQQPPFSKYQSRVLIDLPEEYFLWFARKGAFPTGRLGDLMQLTLTIEIAGLQGLVTPLKQC